VGLCQPGRDPAALDAAERERLRQHRARSERVRGLLDQHIPQQCPVVRPPLRLLQTAAEQHDAYRRLARQTEHEALLATPLPGSSNGTQGTNADGGQQDGALDPVLADLAGRVETWVLYGADESDPAEDSAAVAALHVCQQAGAYARTVADLPLQWAVFDRRAALVTLATPDPAGGGAPTVALIEHPGFAEVSTKAFKYRWGGGAPCACPDH
jgi:hypothetical protein